MNLKLVELLQAEKSKLFEEMGKHPEKEQQLAEEYFSIEQQITDIFKNTTPEYSRGNAQ